MLLVNVYDSMFAVIVLYHCSYQKEKQKSPKLNTDGWMEIIRLTEIEQLSACTQQPLDISQADTGLIVEKMNNNQKG